MMALMYQFKTQRSSARKFSFLASTVDFLSEHNFDFNTTFSQGVQYLTVPEEKALVQKLEEKKEKVREELKKKAEQKPEEPVKPDLSDLSEGEQGKLYLKKVMQHDSCLILIDINSSGIPRKHKK